MSNQVEHISCNSAASRSPSPKKDGAASSIGSELSEEEVGKSVLEPNCHDVCRGKGYKVIFQSGNSYFRELVKALRNEYVVTPKAEKKHFAKQVNIHIQSLDPPGRFLDRPSNDGPYIVLGAKAAMTKTSQALRERSPCILKKIEAGEIHVKKIKKFEVAAFILERSKEVQETVFGNKDPISAENILRDCPNWYDAMKSLSSGSVTKTVPQISNQVMKPQGRVSISNSALVKKRSRRRYEQRKKRSRQHYEQAFEVSTHSRTDIICSAEKITRKYPSSHNHMIAGRSVTRQEKMKPSDRNTLSFVELSQTMRDPRSLNAFIQSSSVETTADSPEETSEVQTKSMCDDDSDDSGEEYSDENLDQDVSSLGNHSKKRRHLCPDHSVYRNQEFEEEANINTNGCTKHSIPVINGWEGHNDTAPRKLYNRTVDSYAINNERKKSTSPSEDVEQKSSNNNLGRCPSLIERENKNIFKEDHKDVWDIFATAMSDPGQQIEQVEHDHMSQLYPLDVFKGEASEYEVSRGDEASKSHSIPNTLFSNNSVMNRRRSSIIESSDQFLSLFRKDAEDLSKVPV